MNADADIVIVGSGPAGSTTALLLARAGFDVLLVDRRTFPRAKPCGDCLSPQTSRLLHELGVLEAIHALRPARLEGWRIVSPGGFSFSGRFREFTTDPLVSSAIAIERSRLDSTLLDAAKRAGARVWNRAHVTGVRAGAVTGNSRGQPFHVRARLVVGADGLRSVVARRLGMALPPRLRKLSLTAHVTGIDMDDGLGEMHVGRGLCAGVAPVTAETTGTCNVTIVADSMPHGRSVAADPVAFLRAALASFPQLKQRVRHLDFAGARRTDGAPVLLASGPFDVPTRRTTGPGFALVGDAAGYFDPFTGQGVFQAMAGASLLAHEAGIALRTRAGILPALSRYEARHRALVRGCRLVQRMIDTILARPGLADFAIRRLAAAAPARNILLAVTGDLAPAHSVFAPAALLAFAGLTTEKSS